MQTVHTISELREHIQRAKQQQTIGFVPTMGNLHAGHLHLIEHSKQDGCFTVASIFVNPMQFNDPNDLANYPRTLAQDQAQLEQAQCDLLFCPSVNEMYPNGQSNQTVVHVPHVSEGLCGGSRPGHFDGVSTVVTKLLQQVQPQRAYFGEKDFQQLLVIKTLVADLCMPIDIIGVATQRAEDGLALSSRNGYLSAQERQQAPELYRTLTDMAAQLRQGASIEHVIREGEACIQRSAMRLDYLDIRRQCDLGTPTEHDTELVILIAAYLGTARLIDNLKLSLNPTSL